MNLVSHWIVGKFLKIQKLIGKYKPTFFGLKRKILKHSKLFSQYVSYLLNHFKLSQKPKLWFLNGSVLSQSSKIPSLVDKYKAIFLGKRSTPSNFPFLLLYRSSLQTWFEVCQNLKIKFQYCIYPLVCFKDCQKTKLNNSSNQVLVQMSKILNLVLESKIFL